MNVTKYAIIPLRLELWKTGDDPIADCLNDLHSSNNALSELFGDEGFQAYNDNRFRFKITENPEYQTHIVVHSEYTYRMLLDVSFFLQNNFKCNLSSDSVEITDVTAQKLMQLAVAIHQQVR